MKCAKEQKGAGDGGYRSPYLSHAKRALYHLSYVPMCTEILHLITCHSGDERTFTSFRFRKDFWIRVRLPG